MNMMACLISIRGESTVPRVAAELHTTDTAATGESVTEQHMTSKRRRTDVDAMR